MKRHRVQFWGVLLLLLLLSTALAAGPAAAQSCNPEIHLTGFLTADNTGQVMNSSSSCTYQVGIASYKKFDNNIDNQELFHYALAMIGPNQTITVGPINLPNCAWQVDLFYGELLTSFAGGVRYGTRLLDARHGGGPFCDPPPPPPPSGCTPGYWKNHLDSWVSYNPNSPVTGVFGPIPSELSGLTLAQALDGGGGPGAVGGARILLRAAVAALLNAAHPDVGYTMSEAEIINAVNAALASNNRNTMLSLAGQLDADNNLGCPLN